MATPEPSQQPASNPAGPPPQTHLDLNYIVPIVNADGNGVFISAHNDVPTLAFFQVRKEEPGHINADVVAAVRMNKISDLQALRDGIDETIRNHHVKEK